jgi:endonuclease III
MFSQQVGFAHTESQERIGAQAIVIVQVFVAQRQRDQALRQQFPQGMIAIPRVTLVEKASAERLADSIVSVDLAQQKRSAIAAEMTAREIGLNGAVEMIVEEKGLLSF